MQWYGCADTYKLPGYVRGIPGNSAFTFYEYASESGPPPPLPTQFTDFDLTARPTR